MKRRKPNNKIYGNVHKKLLDKNQNHEKKSIINSKIYCYCMEKSSTTSLLFKLKEEELGK